MSMIKNVLYEDIVKLLRKAVIDTLNIDPNRVMNSLSVRGVDLQKMISSTVATSYSLNDTFILFDVTENDNDKYYVVPEENDDSISSISSFNFNMKMYGNACHNVSQKLLCGFKNQDMLIELREKGIYVAGVGKPKMQHEFINNTLWSRSDITIKVKVRFNFGEIDVNYFEKEKLDKSNIDIKII